MAENADDPDNGDWAIRNGVSSPSSLLVLDPALNCSLKKRMLIESETVLTDSDARLGKAVEDLRALMVRSPFSFEPSRPTPSWLQVEARKISELSDDPDFIAAEEGLELAMI